MKIIQLKDMGKADCLWGASLSEQYLRRIWDELKTTARSSPLGAQVVLDFKGIQAANVSFIKGTFLWLLQNGMAYAKKSSPPALPWSSVVPPALNVVPFVANPNAEIRAEVDEVLSRHGYPYLVATKWTSGEVRAASVAGCIDEVLLRTLFYVVDAGEATASTLCEEHADEGIAATGWNNRLADLFERRLLSKSKSGRSLVYKPVVQEIHHG
jgi:hypothetical protein